LCLAQVPQVEWLDRLSLPHISKVLSELSSDPRGLYSRPYCAEGERGLAEHGFLVVTLPMFQVWSIAAEVTWCCIQSGTAGDLVLHTRVVYR
jgi:hypothetical protein